MVASERSTGTDAAETIAAAWAADVCAKYYLPVPVDQVAAAFADHLAELTALTHAEPMHQARARRLGARLTAPPFEQVPSLIAETAAAYFGMCAQFAGTTGDDTPDRWTAVVTHALAGYADTLRERALDQQELLLSSAITMREKRIRTLQDELQYAATHDQLTGLANRILLHQQVTAALAVTGRPLAVLVIDLDRFKSVNDTHGHAAGDELLVAVAGRLSDTIRTDDIACRYGGDEFVVATPAEAPAATALAGRLLTVLAEPFVLRIGPTGVHASIGIACTATGLAAGAVGVAELIQAADRAMYVAKTAGGGRYHLR